MVREHQTRAYRHKTHFSGKQIKRSASFEVHRGLRKLHASTSHRPGPVFAAARNDGLHAQRAVVVVTTAIAATPKKRGPARHCHAPAVVTIDANGAVTNQCAGFVAGCCSYAAAAAVSIVVRGEAGTLGRKVDVGRACLPALLERAHVGLFSPLSALTVADARMPVEAV